MNFYRKLTKQPLDVFGDYKFDPQNEQDREDLLSVGQTIRNMTKICHKKCFDKQSNNFSDSCVEQCFNHYFDGVKNLVKQSEKQEF